MLDSQLRELQFILEGPEGKFDGVSAGSGMGVWAVRRPELEGGHKWWYLGGMKPDEVMLIKCLDSSEKEGRCRRAPHGAVEDNRYMDAAPRESVEVRCPVIWEDESAE